LLRLLAVDGACGNRGGRSRVMRCPGSRGYWIAPDVGDREVKIGGISGAPESGAP
jgi:hypothetical protein